MKQLRNILNSTNIIKILVLFSVGFLFRILIYHYLGVNVFQEYISILYYFGMFSFIVYYDQLFSCQYNGPLNVELINTKFFDDYSKGSLLFQKESTNPSKEFSKIKYIENKTPNYIRMRPSFDKKGNILIIPAIDFSGSNSSSRS